MPFKFNPLSGTLDYYEAGSGGGAWGDITGTLSDQTDLQSALDDKQDILTEGAFVDGDKTKLDGIESGAEVNNISDANATDLTDGGETSLHTHAGGGGGDTAYDQANYVYDDDVTSGDPGATFIRLGTPVFTATNKYLLSNVAQIYGTPNHSYVIGDTVEVNIGDPVFDGTHTVTTVTANSIKYAKVNANVSYQAASGTFTSNVIGKVVNLYVDQLGVGSEDYQDFWAKLKPGNTITINNTTDVDKWSIFQVSGTVVDNTGWFTVPVIWVAGTSRPDNGDSLTVRADMTQAGRVHVYETVSASQAETPPVTLGVDGDICFIKPSSTTQTMKNYGWRISQKVAGAWVSPQVSGSNTHFVPYIPVMGASTSPTPVTGQAVSIPAPSGGDVVQSDWYTNNGATQPLYSAGRYYAPYPGEKVSIGKGLGAFGSENMAFFNGQAQINALPMDTDSIKMKWSTNTAATDPGTQYLKVNNATAASITQVYISELGTSRTVTTKALTSNVATITTSTAHSYFVKQKVTVSGVDATFNGTYEITAVTSTTFSYAKTAANVSPTASGGTVNADITQQFNYNSDESPYAVRIVQDSDATKFIHLIASSYATDNGTWRTLPVTFAQVGAGGLPANLADCTVKFYYNNRYWIANGYGQSQYGIGMCVKGDGNISLRGVADRGIYDSLGGTFYITNTVLTSNVVTITTSQAHGFAVGQRVVITNATNTTYNGTYTITTVPSGTTFTYAKTNANIGSAVSIGEACNGAKAGDFLVINKYVSEFFAYLVNANVQVYALPRPTVQPFRLTSLLAYDDLLGTQGLMVTTTSRDHNIISAKFTY